MSDAGKARALLDDISLERQRGARNRLIFSLTVLGMFGLFATNVYGKIKSFDTEALLAHLQARATTTVWPLVYKELDEVGKAAVPALSAALANEVESFGPRLSDKLASEGEVFQVNIAHQMKSSLDASLASAFEARQDELKGRLGGLSEDDALYDDLIRRLQASTRGWAQTELDTTFDQHIHVLQSINETVGDLMVQAREHHGDTSQVTEEDVMLIMSEILTARVAGVEG